MIRKIALAGIASAALALGSLAASGVANAAPAVAPTSFTNFGIGEAGILLAEDNHTHYRYVQSVTEARTVLGSLNNTSVSPTIDGAQGSELCDPNTGFVAQVGLFYDGANGKYYIAYADGYFNSDGVNEDTDVCASGGLLDTITEDGTLNPTLSPADVGVPQGDSTGLDTVEHSGLIPVSVTTGQNVLTSVYYDRHGHISFGVANEKTGWARSPQVKTAKPEFWEAGAGAFTPTITTNAFDAITPILVSNVLVNFYSSVKPAYPIYTETPYFGVGGVVAVSAATNTATLSPVEVTTSSFTLTESE
jgi:hypothetical protein